MESNIESRQMEEKIGFKPQWRSGYNPVALETLEKVTRIKIKRVHPEATEDNIKKEVKQKKGKLSSYLDAIDQEFVDNFGVFTSESDPEVRFPYTVISIRNAANRAFPQKTESREAAEERRKRTVYSVFTPFSPPPGGDPSDPINTIYDRVMISLPEIRKKEDILIYVLGLPTSKWGSVSDKWVEDLEKGVESEQEQNGFSQHGRLYAEFLRPIFNKYLEDPETKTNIIFRGDSMGTILANKTAGELPEIWKNLRLLLDVPTGTHKPTGRTIKLPFVGTAPLSFKGMQAVGGFGSEVALRMLTDELVKRSLSGKKQSLGELTTVLNKKGIEPFESDLQNKLKKDAFIKEIKLLIKGTPLDTDNFRSYIVQGLLDPATVNIERIKFLINRSKTQGFFDAGSRSLGMGINYTHWMDRGRWPDKWIRGIETYEKP